MILDFNKVKIPLIGLYIIRYHSCYPWHNQGEYKHLMEEGDEEILKWVLEFNK